MFFLSFVTVKLITLFANTFLNREIVGVFFRATGQKKVDRAKSTKSVRYVGASLNLTVKF